MTALKQGDILAGYQLINKVGVGGFCEVWEVKSTEDRIFAMKIMDITIPSNVEQVNMLDMEFQKTKDLIHPNLLLPRNYGLHENQYKYLVMPLCKCSLMSELEDRKKKASNINGNHKKPYFSEEELAKILHDVADGLAYLNKNGIIHKDIKPDNVMLYSGNTHTEYLISDFGISEKHPVSRISKETTLLDGKNKGLSIAYASPEYFRNQIHRKSDVFSLGIMLYELITGELPGSASGMSFGESLSAKSSPLRWDISVPIAGILKSIISECLKFKPDARPSTENLAEWADYYLQNGYWKPITPPIPPIPPLPPIKKLITIFIACLLIFVFWDYGFHSIKLQKVQDAFLNGNVQLASSLMIHSKTYVVPHPKFRELDIVIGMVQSNYKSIQPFYNGIALATYKDSRMTLISIGGKELLPSPVDFIENLNEGKFLVMKSSNGSNCKPFEILQFDYVGPSDFEQKKIYSGNGRLFLKKASNNFCFVDCNDNLIELNHI